MTKLKVAQIGVANFGARRREIMRETGLFELVACYDLNPAAMARCQAEDGARPVGSYAELLATPGIEAVIISTGAKFHADQILQAAERGLHVYVEKPLCASAAELAAVLNAQRRRGVVIGVGHNDHRHDPVSQRIRDLIESGTLGKIATFEKTTAHGGGLQIKPGDWRGDPSANPGGMLFQCGVHGLHELIYYFGPITEVFAQMRYDVHTTATADVALCQLRFASGLIGTLNAYHVTPYRHTFNIFGTHANLYREDRYFDEGTHLWLQRAAPTPGHKETREPVSVDFSTEDEGGGMKSFYAAIRDGGECYPSVVDGARAVAVVFAAEESARSGRPVAVAPVGGAHLDTATGFCRARIPVV
jgi:predicted dehydrogenase